MLIQRVITALVLLPPLLALVWFSSTPLLYVVLSVVVLGVAWEWAGLMGLPSRRVRAAYVGVTALALAAAWPVNDYWIWFALIAAVWWLFALYLLTGYPSNFAGRRPPAGFMAVVGLILVIPTVVSLAALHAMADGALRVLYVFILIFAADIGAYFAGRSFGRKKLASRVSPGKTVEGALGGLALCAAWALAAANPVFKLEGGGQIAALVILSVVVACVSIVGDLTESMFKRIAGVKDSGALLPGHGGLLDRVDSIVAAVPVMALGLHLLDL